MYSIAKTISIFFAFVGLSINASAQWSPSGQNIYYSTGNVGIGTTNPTGKLDVRGGVAQIVNGGYTWIARNADPGNDSYFFHQITPNYHMLGSNKNGTGVIRKIGFSIGGGDLESDVKMVLDQSGNLGVGVASPTAKVDIRGGSLQVVNSGVNGYTWIARNVDPGNDSYFFHQITPNYHMLGSNKNGTGVIRKIGFSIGGGDLESDVKMVLDQSGNLGVGVASPTAKVDIRGGSLQVVNNNVNGYTMIGRNADPGNDSYFYQLISQNFHMLGSSKNGAGALKKLGFAIGTSDTEADIKMTIDPSGNVGIGTPNPDAKLAVKGTIHTQEVKVDLLGSMVPDYVFESNYQLPSLESIETYIDENKHLPEVPSAKEMEANGVNLGEMNMLLLKKIEELTLYVIEQNKKIESQGSRIRELEAKK